MQVCLSVAKVLRVSQSPTTHAPWKVDTVLAEVEAAGGKIVKPAKTAFWGGYSGYFRDLDGHLWEVARNPGFQLDALGAVKLPD
jgi:uncharacterized glyoxalase superfamily protein PhnB